MKKIEQFSRSETTDDVDSSFREYALGVGIKRVQLEENHLSKLQTVATKLRDQLQIDLFNTHHIAKSARDEEAAEDQIATIEEKIRAESVKIDRLLAGHFDNSQKKRRVCPRNWHDSSSPDVEGLSDFVVYILKSPEVPQI